VTQCTKAQFVGLDVHKDSIVIAVAQLGREAARVIGTVPHEWNALRKVLDKLGPRCEVACCYEAGPTGCGLARALIAAGWACDVIAPSLLEANSEALSGSQVDSPCSCRAIFESAPVAMLQSLNDSDRRLGRRE
jgi:hypothetical protein